MKRDLVKEREKGIIIGVDIHREFTQISYAISPEHKIETMEISKEYEKYNIPTYLCKRKGINQWYYGRDAFKKKEEGIFLEDILFRALSNDKVWIEESEINYTELFTMYFRKILSMMAFVRGNMPIHALVITARVMNKEMVDLLLKTTREIGIHSQKVFLKSHDESLYHYVIHQPKELWEYAVGIMDFSTDHLVGYRVEVNSKTTPCVTFIHETEYPQIYIRDDFVSDMEKEIYLKKMETDFLEVSQEFTSEIIFSSIYLVGGGFTGDFYKPALSVLGRNRRVFGGNNLYSKGACLCGIETIFPSELAEKYIFLGKEKLVCNVSVLISNADEQEYLSMLDAGISWFDAKAEKIFLLGEEKQIELIITPLNHREVRRICIDLCEFNGRPEKTVRVKLNLSMCSSQTLCYKVTDLGFGDFFKPLPNTWEDCIMLD